MNIFWGFGHINFQPEICMGFVAHDVGFFHPEGSYFGNDFFVVKFIVVVAAHDVTLVNFFSQVTAGGVLQKWGPAGSMRSKEPLAFLTGFLAFLVLVFFFGILIPFIKDKGTFKNLFKKDFYIAFFWCCASSPFLTFIACL